MGRRKIALRSPNYWWSYGTRNLLLIPAAYQLNCLKAFRVFYGEFNARSNLEGYGVAEEHCGGTVKRSWVSLDAINSYELLVFRFEAHFRDGLKNGFGVLITDDGDRIHGEWVNDTFQTYFHRSDGQLVIGNSTLVNAKFSDGREYCGEHLNFEMFHGFGVETVKTPEGAISFRGEVLHVINNSDLLLLIHFHSGIDTRKSEEFRLIWALGRKWAGWTAAADSTSQTEMPR